MNLSDIQQLLATNLEETQTILDGAAAEDGRDLTDDEVARLAELNDENERLEHEAKAVEKRQAELARAVNIRERITAPREKPEASGRTALPGRAVTSDVRESVIDDPKRGWKNLGEFAGAVRDAYCHGSLALDKRLVIGAAIQGMTTKVGKDGGFATPTEFASSIWDEANLEDEANLMAQADAYNVTGGKLSFNANAETSRTVGNRYGGIRGYWMNEGATFTASGPELRQMDLEPKKLGVLAYMTSELLEQSTALDQFLTRAAGAEIRFLVNDSMVNGNGVGKPVGILNGDATISVSAETNQAATTIKAANIDKMWSRCHPRARQSANWYVNIDIEPQLAALNRASGTAGALVYNPPGGISGAPYATLKGRPVVPTEFNATLGTVGDIILGNFGWYALGTRGGVRSDTSIHVQFLTDQTAFRFIFYADGQPWLKSAITPFKGTNTLSPFVGLATR